MSNISAVMYGQKYIKMYIKCPACGVVVYRRLHDSCPFCGYNFIREGLNVNSNIQANSMLTSGTMDSSYDRIEQDVKED